ncbi:hypothetical protein A3C98_02920 [Candidatus Roizmanbacteria bacterium RIFCSPHIGHO2_02_FULL_37_15]|nr:MAG: hypothetical protein A2859_05995 [Candidatus Roizmanbacteria bacterium RIFCSPHIGHO2_01_FULL_37_16b]OGK20857.1 MAG: hypothetical protein A3C98_02920 [Candidatus Roizmanbacteria bacterium RIFCSPHIGHO2_02_FULL_37_15]OGK31888.1 MAG: hypothetical protein A3F57_04055 [Candidatus Roizmanbacteria bacterium RIFCSPHIGHO2_12_FULL_36_11]OGK57268.1 MAG: hypothetical protein A3I50_05060 [Candidatus Roizmanbacteria bacterium RIFCSPLOWO2_02_FULL_37_9]
MDKKTLHILTYSFVVVGALNWGLVALLNFNLVNALFGSWPTVERLIYLLVGASAVYDFAGHAKYCKYCGEKKS